MFPDRVRKQVLSRASGRCERCGLTSFRYEFHHRRPRGMGGSKRPDTNLTGNCLLLCPDCHRAVEANRLEAAQFGWLVPQGVKPTDVPVLRRGTWVVLSDDGTVKPSREGE